MEKHEKEYIIVGAIIFIIAVGILTFVGTIYCGIYHLLDKLIDKL